MTPKEHIAEAERLLEAARQATAPGESIESLSLATQAQGHALIALAVESGAPHTAAPAEVPSAGS